MATASENLFNALANHGKSKKTSKIEQSMDEIALLVPQSSEEDPESSLGAVSSSNDDSWNTVQFSTKRRLAPQYVLSKSDLGVDNSKARTPQTDALKKKVIRFTKEEILALRVETKVLEALGDIQEIVSIKSLPPSTDTPLDADDIARIWNTASGNTVSKGNDGRGRGGNNNANNNKPRRQNDDGEDDGGDNQWSRGHHGRGQDDLWDSSTSAATYSKGGGFDLSDFAAMAEKFKQDTLALTKLEKGVLGGMDDYAGMKKREDEALDRLMREQAELEGDEVPVEKLLSDVVVEGDDDEDMPDWAVDDEDQAGGHAGVKSDTKRNLLLETLHGKTNESGEKGSNIKLGGLAAAAQPNLFSFQTDESDTATSTATMSSAPAIKPQAVGVGSPIDAGYLSSVNLSDVLGKLLPGVASQPYQQQVAPVSASLPVSAPILAPVAAPALVEEEWEYLDPQSAIQGPFSSKGMRRWLESGYFKPELPIRVRSWTRFFPLGIVFPSQDVAFLKPIPEPGTQQNPLRGVSFEDPVMRQSNSFFAAEQQQRRQILEQQRQQQLQIEHQRQQQQQQLLLEQQRQQQLQSDQQRQQQAMEQHRQQQLLLERQQQQLLERHQQHQEEQRLMEMMQQQQQRQQAAPKSAPVVASWASTDTAKPQKTLKQIQQEEAQQSAAASIVPSVADPSSMSLKLKSLLGVTGAGPATGAAISSAAPWGAEKASTTAASASSTAHGKSLKEIQQEEQQEILRQQQLLLQQQQQLQKRLQQQQKEEEAASRHALSTASSWADKNTKGVATKGPSLKDIMNAEAQAVPVETQTAGRGSGNSWAAKLGVGQTPPPTVISRPAASTNVSASTTVETSSSAAPSKSVAPTKTPSAPSKSNGSTGTAGSKSTDFGGKKMLPELEEFCLASMQKLNGTNDITLLQFCMTLKSAAEIREYLAAYLGSKPEVSQFATEFIRRKEGGAPSASTGPSTAGAAVSSGVLKDVKILKRTPKK